jgi:DNA-directed RNA polymerase subunit H (RpoH/RPB5)
MSSVLADHINIRNNIIDLLKDRGFDSEHLDELYKDISFEEFKKLFKNHDFDIRVPHNTLKLQGIVYYTDIFSDKFKKEHLLKALKMIEDTRDPNMNVLLFIIINGKEQSTIRSIILNKHKENKSLPDGKRLNIEVFNFNKLKYNPTKHVDVPRHILINDKSEIEHIMKVYKVTDKGSFPRILMADPINKWYGGKPGNLFRIIRSNPCSPDYHYYRVVVVKGE